MISREATILAEIARFMSIGECAKQQRHFRFPYPVYYGEELRVAANPRDAAAATKEYLTILASDGVKKVTVDIIGTLSETETGCCLRVVWSYEGELGRILAATQNDVYFSRENDGEPKISQIDIHVSSNESLRKLYKQRQKLYDA